MAILRLTADRSGERCDQFLARQLPQLSRSAAQRLLEEGAVTRKGIPLKKNDKTTEGEEIVLALPDPVEVDVLPQNIPLDVVYEDEDVFAFHDIHPWAPVHFLIVPKLHLPSMASATPEHAGLLGHMMLLAPRLAIEQGCNPYPDGGYRIVVNTGTEGGQEVHHLHMHVIGGPRPWLRG